MLLSKLLPYFEVLIIGDVINESYKVLKFQILAKNISHILANFSRIMLILAKFQDNLANFSSILLKLAEVWVMFLDKISRSLAKLLLNCANFSIILLNIANVKYSYT